MPRMKVLGVNIDHVVTIRQARLTEYPDPVAIVHEAIAGGADQITIHLREDRRHIQDQDVYNIVRKSPLAVNMEMACVDDVIRVAIDAKPRVATIVPEKRKELTTESGLDLKKDGVLFKKTIDSLSKADILVSLFIDPDQKDVKMAKEIGAQAVEFHTGAYANNFRDASCALELARLKECVQLADELGLRVCAGHGLNYENLKRLVEEVPLIEEYNIGHAIVARSVFVGFKNAVKEMKELLISGR